MIGIIVLVFIAYSVGNSGAEVTLEDEKVTYTELSNKIAESEEKLDKVKKDLESKEKELDAKQEKFKKVESLISQKDEIEKELSDLKTDVKEKEEEVKTFNAKKKDKEKELESLEGDILEAQGKPISITAGEWIVGEDIPVDRYEASGSSNFVVRDSLGGLKVNTILGSGGAGRGNYVFFAEEGDNITASAAATLTPVE